MNTARFFFPYKKYGKIPGRNEGEKAARTHKMAGAKLKDTWTERVANEILMQLGRVKLQTPVFIACLWVEPDRRRDKDNVASGRKYIHDGMVLHGLIKNDTWNMVGGIDDKFSIDRENSGVYVTVTEMDDENYRD